MNVDSTSGSGHRSPLSVDDARTTGSEAFVFGFPLLLTLTSMEQATGARGLGEGRARVNHFGHFAQFADPDLRAMVAVDCNTLYSLAWLDLRVEPIVLNIPDTERRSFMVSIVSAWNDTIACLGPRESGSTGGRYLLTRDDWAGTVPPGMKQLRAPTDVVLVVAHMHARDVHDLEGAGVVQRGLTLTPLSTHGSGDADAAAAAAAGLLSPTASSLSALRTVLEMNAEEVFNQLAFTMGRNPAGKGDGKILGRLAAMDLLPGKSFEWTGHRSEIHTALEAGVDDGKTIAASALPQQQSANGWQTPGPELGTYEADYVRRAQTANLGLGTVSPADASFPICFTDANGQQTNGAGRYLLRFEPDELPQVGGLWSLAIYDMDQLCVANLLDRYALGDRDDLTLGADGSLELEIQRERPDGPESNWLPAPEGDFYLMLHMYSPSPRMLEGTWSIPPVLRIADPVS